MQPTLATLALNTNDSYRSVSATMTRTYAMLATEHPLTYRAWIGLGVRLAAHAHELKTAHVHLAPTTLPSGLTIGIHTWDCEQARLTYSQLRRLERTVAEMAQFALATPDDRTAN